MKVKLFSKNLIKQIYNYLEKSTQLRKSYTIENFHKLILSKPFFIEHIFTIENYISSGYEEYILAELEDHIDLINSITEESELLDIVFEINDTDIEYVIEIIKKYCSEYTGFLRKNKLLEIICSSNKIIFGMLTRTMEEDLLGSRSILVSSISISLVGVQAPCPCANGLIKSRYSALFHELERYNEI